MFLDEVYDEGVEAIDYILKEALHYEVRKALDPLNAHHFEILTKSIAQSLKGHTIPVEAAALKKAMNALDAKWTEMSPEARGKLLGVATGYLGAPVAHAVIPKIEQTLKFAGKDLIEDTKKSSVQTYDLKISPSMTARDDLTLSSLITSNGNYVRDQYGKRSEAMSMKAKEIVGNGLAKGLGSDDITEDLHAALSAQSGRGRGYWDMIAMVFANRARTSTQLLSYHEAGITSYLWESVLDEATSDQCRFMHGRRFNMKKAVDTIDKVDSLKDPEDIEQIQPFLSVGNHPDGGKGIYYSREDGSRSFVTSIKDSGVGFKDDTGSYSHMHSDESLQDQGFHMPPIHGRCRSTVIPSESPAEPGTVTAPPEPGETPPPPPKLKGGALKAQALSQLADVNEGGEVTSSKFFTQSTDEIDYLDHPFWNENIGAAWEANKVSKKPKIDDLVATTPSFDADKTANYIKKPLALDKASKPQVVKWKGKFLIVAGHEQIAAQKLMGQKQAYVEVVDLDKPTKPGLVVAPAEPLPPETSLAHVVVPEEPPAPEPPPPLSPALAPPKEPLAASVVLGEKTGAAQGSNEGGFYKGTDGVNRYVKFYSDPSQAYGEHLANSIYSALGHVAPESNVFEHNGKLAYASDIVTGTPLGTVGLNAARAKEVMKGFIADVLVGNWDVAGATLDNLMVDHAGQIVRIDNGGSFLMRAKAGRKPTNLLNEITEWDKLFESTNPSYSKIAHAAGYDSAADMKDLILPEIKKVSALRDAYGGWASYVEKIAPGLPAGDKSRIVEMLDKRTRLLEAKAEILKRPGPVDPSQPIIGHLPKKPLPDPSPTSPGARSSDEYRRNQKKRIEGAQGIASVKAFTDGEYSEIRDFEIDGKMSRDAIKHSKEIEKFFQSSTPTPGTVYRGIGPSSRKPAGLRDDEMRAFLESDEFVLGGTTSTSRAPSVAYSFGKIGEDYRSSQGKNRVLLILNQKSAVGIESVSEVSSELELLMAKECKFKITGRYAAAGQKNVLIIEAEEIGSGPKKA